MSGTPRWEEEVRRIRGALSSPSLVAALRSEAEIFPDLSKQKDVRPLFEVEADPGFLFSRQERIVEALAAAPSAIATRAFWDLVVWKDLFSFETLDIDGALTVLASQPSGVFLYWPPLACPLSCGTIREVFERMSARNSGGGVSRIENLSRDEAAVCEAAGYRVRMQREEYFYDRSAIAKLQGGAYKSRRHDIHLLERSHDPVYRPFEAKDIEGCLELLGRWLDKRSRQYEDDTYRHLLMTAAAAHRAALRQGVRAGLAGRVVEIAGGIAAYTFGAQQGPEVVTNAFEVTDPDIPGLSAFIFQRFAADPLWQGARLINAMDDAGIPSLQRTKMSWRPVRKEPVFVAT
ncbi:MAG: DUF2156 domain-containing protein [Elusimicrobia bacterium]|nr:DUF2156 domain-containing protein [Elusimicrobiota bacterium]